MTETHNKIGGSVIKHPLVKEYPTNIMTASPSESKELPNTHLKKSLINNRSLKGKKVQTTSYTTQLSLTQDNKSDWTRMASLLERIENRLNKLEEKEINKIHNEPNAHNRS